MQGKLFYSIREIAAILDCSYTKAEEIAHMFLERGDGVRHGKLIRVNAQAFDAWCNLG